LEAAPGSGREKRLTGVDREFGHWAGKAGLAVGWNIEQENTKSLESITQFAKSITTTYAGPAAKLTRENASGNRKLNQQNQQLGAAEEPLELDLEIGEFLRSHRFCSLMRLPKVAQLRVRISARRRSPKT